MINNNGIRVIYSGPLVKPLTLLKRLSAVTLGSTLFVTPFMNLVDFGAIDPKLVFGLMTGAITTQVFSTSLVHWAVKPYISKIYNLNDSTILVETLSFFGNPVWTPVSTKDLVLSDKMFTSFALSSENITTNTTIDTETVKEITRQFKLKKTPISSPWKPRTSFYIHSEMEDEFTEEMRELVKLIRRNSGKVSVINSEAVATNSTNKENDSRKNMQDESIKTEKVETERERLLKSVQNS